MTISVAEELVERERRGERRQPHRVRRRGSAGEDPPDQLVEHRSVGPRPAAVRDDSPATGSVLGPGSPEQPRLERRQSATAVGRRRRRPVRTAATTAQRGSVAAHPVRRAARHRARRELVRVVGADDGAALGGAERAQRDPVAEMALQPAEPALVEALRREQQVDAEAAAEPADGVEQLDELGLGGQQLAELVDHDDEVGQRLQLGVGRRAARGTPRAEARLPVARSSSWRRRSLAEQGVVHAVDEGLVVGEVGDERRPRGAARTGRRRRRRP